MRDRLGANAVPVQLPIGQEEHFAGVIDLVEMKAIVYKDDLGQEFDVDRDPDRARRAGPRVPPPADRLRSRTSTTICSRPTWTDEGAVTTDQIKSALAPGDPREPGWTPVLLGSAFKNKGVQPLLDAVIDYLPSPLDVPPVRGIDPKTNAEAERAASLDAPFSALAFKVMSDPYVGKLTYFRVYSGKLKSGDRVLNTTTGKTERVGRILQMHANHREERDEIGAGEIAAGVWLEADDDRRHARGRVAADRAGVDDLPGAGDRGCGRAQVEGQPGQADDGLSRLAEEDPTFKVTSDEETGQTLIAGMGELHLEIIIDRLMREFNVAANVGRPQVAYRETISRPAEKVRGRFVRQTGGSGQYGDVEINLLPQEAGAGYEFVNKIVGGKIPKEYIPAVNAGIVEAMGAGVLAGVPGRQRQDRTRQRVVPRRRLERARVQDRGFDGVQGRDEAGQADPARAGRALTGRPRTRPW